MLENWGNTSMNFVGMEIERSREDDVFDVGRGETGNINAINALTGSFEDIEFEENKQITCLDWSPTEIDISKNIGFFVASGFQGKKPILSLYSLEKRPTKEVALSTSVYALPTSLRSHYWTLLPPKEVFTVELNSCFTCIQVNFFFTF